ncbi:MAG: mechanosensitive ion channel family protein, partial [Bacteroidia bacterium]|nr:mechanosensitive ion channel family protein [Bacteroidia bacterium]
MDNLNEFLRREYYDNTVQAYLIAAGGILLGLAVVRAFRKVILKKIKNLAATTQMRYDDLVVEGIEKFGLPIVNLAIVYWGVKTLTLPEKAGHVVGVALAVVVAYFLI